MLAKQQFLLVQCKIYPQLTKLEWRLGLFLIGRIVFYPKVEWRLGLFLIGRIVFYPKVEWRLGLFLMGGLFFIQNSNGA